MIRTLKGLNCIHIMLKKTSHKLISIFYIIAGLNHFINPEFYTSLIPKYFVYIALINVLSGIVEILLGVGLQIKRFQKFSAYLIIAMLIAFIPSHVYFIQIGHCVENGLCTSEIIAWLRLILVHPILILWAYWYKK